MATEWLTARSFERSHEIIAAINTLSIHGKRILAGKLDDSRREEIADARRVLFAFLDRFSSVVSQAEQQPDATIIGADPRLSSLAKRFMAAKRQLPQRSLFYARSLDDLRDLLRSDKSEDQERLIESLRDLRVLIEQHSHADIVGILGEI